MNGKPYSHHPKPTPLEAANTRITELEAELKLHQWQPIETAPKDETPILIFGGMAHPEVGKSRKINRAVLVSWSINSESWDVLDCDYFSITVENPTHWMPLPAPPIQAKGEL